MVCPPVVGLSWFINLDELDRSIYQATIDHSASEIRQLYALITGTPSYVDKSSYFLREIRPGILAPRARRAPIATKRFTKVAETQIPEVA